MNIALFDFNGTISNKDSLIEFIKGKKALVKGAVVLSPYIVLYKTKLLNSQKMKESFLKYFLKNMKDNNDRVIIVSASLECILKPWCDYMDAELIATKLSLFGSKFAGKLYIKNCIGKEKVRKILQIVDIKDHNKVYAYGNSNGDKDMLGLANERYYKRFS